MSVCERSLPVRGHPTGSSPGSAGLRAAAASEKCAQSADAVEQPFLARGEAPAHEALAFGTEGAAGCETEPRLMHEPLAEFEAVGHAGDAEEDVHRARWRRDFDAVEGRQLPDQKIARGTKAREGVLHGR